LLGLVDTMRIVMLVLVVAGAVASARPILPPRRACAPARHGVPCRCQKRCQKLPL